MKSYLQTKYASCELSARWGWVRKWPTTCTRSYHWPIYSQYREDRGKKNSKLFSPLVGCFSFFILIHSIFSTSLRFHSIFALRKLIIIHCVHRSVIEASFKAQSSSLPPSTISSHTFYEKLKIDLPHALPHRRRFSCSSVFNRFLYFSMQARAANS